MFCNFPKIKQLKEIEFHFTVLLGTDENKPFDIGGIEIEMLTLISDNFQEIYLKQESDHNNQLLFQVKNQNVKINKIFENQKQVIEGRAKEVVE